MFSRSFQTLKGLIILRNVVSIVFVIIFLTSCLPSNNEPKEITITPPGRLTSPSETSSSKGTTVSSSIPSATVLPSSTANVPTITVTSITENTPVPRGVLALILYPPFFMNYDSELWEDKSEYGNSNMIINYLENQKINSCTLGVQGPSGFFPENMDFITLGKISYQVYTQESSDKINTFYFADNLTTTDGNIPSLVVQSGKSQAHDCKVEAEKVLSSLR